MPALRCIKGLPYPTEREIGRGRRATKLRSRE